MIGRMGAKLAILCMAISLPLVIGLTSNLNLQLDSIFETQLSQYIYFSLFYLAAPYAAYIRCTIENDA